MKSLLLLLGLGNALVLHAPLRRARLAPRRVARLAGADLDELEARALAAADAWGTDATDFLPAVEADEATARLTQLSDVAIVGAGGRDGAARRRLVMTRPEIVDAEGEAAIAAAHATLLAVSADLGGSDPIPNVLIGIGIALDNVGDVLVSEDGGNSWSVEGKGDDNTSHVSRNDPSTYAWGFQHYTKVSAEEMQAMWQRANALGPTDVDAIDTGGDEVVRVAKGGGGGAAAAASRRKRVACAVGAAVAGVAIVALMVRARRNARRA